MKKTVFVLMLLGAGLCAFAQNGVIRQLSGTVELRHSGETAYVPAKTGDTVSENTVVSTSFRSYATIDVGGTAIHVQPTTRLTLTEIRALNSNESLQMNLRTGSVRVQVTPPAGIRSSVSVQSPSATASVRGTSFYFDTRNLSVTQGTVLFRGNRGYTIQAGAGSSTVVGWSGTASAPQYTADYFDTTPYGWDYSCAGTGGTEAVLGLGSTPSGPGFGDVGVDY